MSFCENSNEADELGGNKKMLMNSLNRVAAAVIVAASFCASKGMCDSTHLQGYELGGVLVNAQCSMTCEGNPREICTAPVQYFGVLPFRGIGETWWEYGDFYKNPETGAYVYNDAWEWRGEIPNGFEVGIYEKRPGKRVYPVSRLTHWDFTEWRTKVMNLSPLSVNYLLDHDGDGANVSQEMEMNTDPFNRYSNGTQLSDGQYYTLITNGTLLANGAACADADDDGVIDVIELFSSTGVPEQVALRYAETRTNYPFFSSPKTPDNDGDKVRDGMDRNPMDASDNNMDGIPDDWLVFWTNQVDVWQFAPAMKAALISPAGDADGDGVLNSAEFSLGTSPIVTNGVIEIRSVPQPIVITAEVNCILTQAVRIVSLSYATVTGSIQVAHQPWCRWLCDEYEDVGSPVLSRALYFGEPRRLDLLIDTTNLVNDATYRTDIRVIASEGGQVVTKDIPVILEVGTAPETRSAPSVPHLVSPVDRAQLMVYSNMFVWSQATNSRGGACRYTLHMDCHIGASNFPAAVAEDLTVTSTMVGRLAYQQTYLWYVVAEDTDTGMQTFSESWMFDTPANNPTTEVSVADGLFWFAPGSEQQQFGITNTGTGELAWEITQDDEQAPRVDFSPTNGCCEHGYKEGYVVTVTSRYEKAAFEQDYTLLASDIGLTLRCGGYFPGLLASGWTVVPQSGAGGLSIDRALSWGHDKLPDCTATGTWHVFFGTNNPPPYAAAVQTMSFVTNSLGWGVTYYWSVSNCITLLAGTAQEHQAPLKSPVFSFTTEAPFVDITNVTGTISVTNAMQYIAGTNTADVVGRMWWSNTLTRAGGSCRNYNLYFTINRIALAVGTNVITVRGTNSVGIVASDAVTVIRCEPELSGVWIKRSGNGSWTDAANWQGGAIANGEDKTANISTLNITANRTISLDRSRTIGHILAADMKPSHSWTIDAGTPAGVLTLAVSTGVPVIDVSSKTLAISAVIAGDDGLCKKGNGTLTLSGANTLTGPIVISNTTLSIMTAATALADARLIDICDGATCDVSAVSGFTIGAAQTLQGKGVLVGTAMVNGTNAPGGDTIGRLTVNGAVCMGTSAVCVMQIDRGAATNADLLVVIGTLTNGGTLKVVNSGAEPQAGDSFNLFDGTNAGVFSAIVLPSLGSGTEWNTGTLYTTGVISVRDTTSPGDVTLFQAGRGAAYDQVELSWSNGATITVLACTNRTYLTSLSNWFVLASGVSTPWTHTTASNYPSVYYRIVSGRYTSSYDVGKFDVNIEPDSIAWLTFPFCVQPGCDTLSKWFARQLEARPQSSWDYATLQKQETPGGTIQNCDYYIDDFETGTTNWWPDNTIAANAGYYIDNWRSGATDFFPSMTGADMIEPGKAYLIFFSSARTGTGVWTCVKPY